MLNRILLILLIVCSVDSAFGKKSHEERVAQLSTATSQYEKVEAYFNIIKGVVNKKQSDSSVYYIEELKKYHQENKIPLTK